MECCREALCEISSDEASSRLESMIIRRLQDFLALIATIVAIAMPHAAVAQSADEDYILGVGDTLNIQVFGEPDLSFDALPVVDEGNIVMPLIGEVRVAGISVRGAQAEIRRRLADGYLINPEVTVSVSGRRPIYVVGEVRNPGRVSYSVGMTVRNAITLAGGLSEQGDDRNIVVERPAAANGTFRVDLGSELRPGDTVNVGRIATFDVRGAVQYPENLRYQPETTLRRAIELAGGFGDNADTGNIKLERGGKVYDVAGSLDSVPVAPGDVLTVGRLSEQAQAQLHVFVQGEVMRGGRYEYVDGMTVEKAIVLAGGFSDRASRRKIDIRRDGDPPVMLNRVDLTDIVLPGDIITVGASIF